MQLARQTEPFYKLDLKQTAAKGIAYILLALLAGTTIFPFLWMVSTSFKQEQRVFSIPPTLLPDPWVWENYPYIFTTMPFELFMWNSSKIAVLAVIGSLFSCTIAAYAFARINFWGKDVLFMATLATLMIPGHVSMIPVYMVMHRLGWIDTHLPLWVPNFFGSAFGIFLIRQYFMTLPQELLDAAKIDGCTHLGVLMRIILPLSKPVLATLALLIFMGSWNQLLDPVLYLNSEENFTLPLALTRFRGMNYTYWTKMMAGSTVSLLPILVLFLFTQQYFVSGITLTGLKQ
jgi:ABC-type glycerol-3-phosphate transport system permease component